MKTLTVRRLRRLLLVVSGSPRSDRRRAAPCDLRAGRASSVPLDRGSMVPLCVLCIEAGRATEATFQTREMLCGCDEHIKLLEQHGRAAIREQRRASRYARSGPADELVRVAVGVDVTR